MGQIQTVVDRLLRSSDSGIQLIVASLRESEDECLSNHKGRNHSRNQWSQCRMRSLQGVCTSDKMGIKSKFRRGSTYLIPNVNWQFLRLLPMEIPGPASAEYWLKVTVTAVLSAIELWVTGILRKSSKHTTEKVEGRSWWTSWSV